MSLVSIFVDAFNKARGKKPAVDMKTYGPMGSTTQDAGKSFSPLRRAPKPAKGPEDHTSTPAVASSDPEEGGERR